MFVDCEIAKLPEAQSILTGKKTIEQLLNATHTEWVAENKLLYITPVTHTSELTQSGPCIWADIMGVLD